MWWRCACTSAPSPWITFLTVIGLALLTVTRMKFLHPFRVRRFMPINIAVTSHLVSVQLSAGDQSSGDQPVVMGLWLLMSAYFLGICFWRTRLSGSTRRGSDSRLISLKTKSSPSNGCFFYA
jgi:phosphatidylcholine synthase